MRIFMLGWEFPPFISGGLGTACYGLTRAMDRLDIKVTFVLPRIIDDKYVTHVKLLSLNSLTSAATLKINEFNNVTFRAISSPLQPYSTPDIYHEQITETLKQKQMRYRGTDPANFAIGGNDYAGDMYAEIHRYAAVAVELAVNEDIDIVHAHDWMTFPAGIAVAAAKERPLIVHVHSTEFDRSGENVNQMIYDIERKGMHAADKIIAVSYLTRNIIISRYGVSGDKVEVVHNGVERNARTNPNWSLAEKPITKDEKLVLFLGRITMQKGPEYFLEAAKKVLEVMDNVKFIMVGSGDMMHRTIEMAAELGIGNKVRFTGFLRGQEVQEIYKMADLFVMPSVSEPFGLVPLEALDNDVPVIISKQSGVSEVLKHALKVDFWDVQEMANKIVAVLKYSPLRIMLQNHGNFEVRRLRWTDAAAKCEKIYNDTLAVVG